MQLSTSGRVVTLCAVSQGVLFFCDAGDSLWTQATNSSSTTPELDLGRLNFGAPNNGELWYVDGVHYRRFNPSTGVISDWTASAGTLPLDDDGRAPRLVETWRSRTMVSGLIGKSYSWFGSKIGDSTDFDYAPPTPGPADAVSSDTGPQGIVGDAITGMIPFNDDTLFLGCNHSLYIFQGDPQANGQISLITPTIGMAFGRAWCIDPYGTCYFFSNRCGVYTLAPGGQPQRISQQINQLVDDIDSGANSVSMTWDERQQGVHVFITPTAAAGTTTHLFFEQRTGGWFQDEFDNPLHNPLCCCQFDGNNPQDRVVAIGSWDGVVRYLDPNASTDDGRLIRSSVVLSPILTQNMDDMSLLEMQALLGSDSGTVDYTVLLGTTPEQALADTERNPVTGTWRAGRNANEYVGRSSHCIYVKIDSENQWRMEQIRGLIRTNGKIRMRAKE